MSISGTAKATTLVVAMLLVAGATACGGSETSSSNLFPQRATSAGSIEFGELTESFNLDLVPVFQALASGVPGESDGTQDFFTLNQAAAFILGRDIGRVDFFSDDESSDFSNGNKGYLGIITHGSFDEATVTLELEAASGYELAQEAYKGINLYSPEDDPDGIVFSVLDDATFAVGVGGALKDIVDLWVGDSESASGFLIDSYNDLSGGILSFASKIPQDIAEGGALGQLDDLGDLPFSLDFLSSLVILGVGGYLNGDRLDITAALEFTNQEAAQSLKEFISGIVTLGSNFSNDPATAELLDGLEVNQDGRRLTIKTGIPKSDLDGMFSQLFYTSSVNSSTQLRGRPPGTPVSELLEPEIGEEIATMPSAHHVPEGQKVEYSTTPPTSGMHWATPAPCGFYPEGLPDERIVHNLEHGHIVVSYNLTNPAEVTELRQVLIDMARYEEWGVARSYDKIPEGQVAVAAWGRLSTSEGVSAADIGLFFEAFAGLMGLERVPC